MSRHLDTPRVIDPHRRDLVSPARTLESLAAMTPGKAARAGMRGAAAAGPWLWGLVGLAACHAVAYVEPNLLEEGILLHVAQRLVHGERLYRDVLAFTGPLPFETLALLFRIFGEEIAVGRAAVAILHGAATATAFWLARRAGAGALAHPAAAAYAAAPLLLFPLFGIYYYTTIAFHLSVLCAAAALRGVGSWRWAACAGVGAAAVALCKQPIGVALAATTALAIGLCGRGAGRVRSLVAFVLGGAATAALTIAWLHHAGTLRDAVHALAVLPANLEETFDAPFMNLWPPGQFAPEIEKSQTFYLPYFVVLTEGLFVQPGWRIMLGTQLLYAIPIVAVGATLLRRLRGPLRDAAWLQAALLVTWMVNLYPRTDWGHLAHVLPVAVSHLCVMFGAARRRFRGFAAAAALLLLAAGSWWSFAQILRAAEPAPLSARVPLRPVSLGLRGAPVRRVIDFLERRTDPGDPIFVARAEPLLYFATATRNPTPYPGVIPGMREEQTRVILEALGKSRYVVMSDVDQPAMTFYRDELPRVQAHLERHFRIPDEMLHGEVHWLVVLEPGPDRGETAIDLLAEAGAARPFERDASGSISGGRKFTDRISTKYNRRPLGFHIGAGGGGLDFELTIPPGAVFQADTGLWLVAGQQDLYAHPLRSRMRVSIGVGSAFTPIVDAPAMMRGSDFRRWTAIEADLSAWAGQRVTLRLELIPGRAVLPGQIGYFGSPRIALRPRGGDERF